jgi:hypothetical protein
MACDVTMLGSMIVLALRFTMGKVHIEDIPKMWGLC